MKKSQLLTIYVGDEFEVYVAESAYDGEHNKHEFYAFFESYRIKDFMKNYLTEDEQDEVHRKVEELQVTLEDKPAHFFVVGDHVFLQVII